MNETRRLIVAALVAALSLSFAACSRSGISSLPPNSAPSSAVSPEVSERESGSLRWELFTKVTSSTEYAYPVVDRQNDIWFESDGNIERMSQSGVNLGTVGTYEQGSLANLTLGGDGNVWYGYADEVSPYTAYLYAANSSGKIVQSYQFNGGFINRPGSEGMYKVYTTFTGIGTDVWIGGEDADEGFGMGVFVRVHNAHAKVFHSSDVPLSATVTPDGNVWFVGGTVDSNYVDKLDLATGKTTEITKLTVSQYEPYPVGTPIVVGADGNVWAVDTGSNGSVLVRTNPSNGMSTRFSIGPDSFVDDLISGPDGNLWASYVNGNTKSTGLLEIPTAGTVEARIPCPASICRNQPSDTVTQLTNAPDGDIWFAYSGVDANTGIGKYVLRKLTERY